MEKVKRRSCLEVLSQRYPGYAKDRLLAYIVCKNVKVEGQICSDPRALVDPDAHIELAFDKYVSRGGFKLEHALDSWHIDPAGLVMLDAGSSTGGFTDCVLQRGASSVHCVDVGYNQLDFRLRTDPRVIVHEKQNIMTLEDLHPRPHAAVADLSFRSIRGAASHILSLTSDTWLISLIKPQFEVPRWKEGFFGVVTDITLLLEVMSGVYDALVAEGVGVHAVVPSPLLGRKGNTEFLALLKPTEGMSRILFKEQLEQLVKSMSDSIPAETLR